MADSVGSGAMAIELWNLVVVWNLFARCGSSSCLVTIVDCEGGAFYVKKKWLAAVRQNGGKLWNPSPSLKMSS